MDIRQFTIEVKGSGSLLGMFITECTKTFPKAIVRDRSTLTQNAIGQEVRLGQAGVLQPQDKAWVQRAGQNLVNPGAADVAVTFSKSGQNENVEVKGNRKLSKLAFVVSPDSSLSNVNQYVRQVIQAVANAA